MEPHLEPKSGLALKIPADPRELADKAIGALQAEAGNRMRLVSVSLEIGVGRMDPDGAPRLIIRRDRTTSTLSFLSLEVRVGEELMCSARGVFSVIPA